jgi:DNA-binding HxlR family transcriptional regulator
MSIDAPSSTNGANVLSQSCPSRRVLELVANKWALLLIPALRHAPVRNNELLRTVEGISQKMLTQTLRELERNGLVRRIDHQTKPLFVEYALTPLGVSLSDVLLTVDRWVEANHTHLDSARQSDARLPGLR